MFVQPRRSVEAQLEVQRDLEEVDGGPVQLANDRQRLRAGDADLAVEPGGMVGPRVAIGVGEKLDPDQLAVVAEADPGLRDARSWATQLRRVDDMHVAARSP